MSRVFVVQVTHQMDSNSVLKPKFNLEPALKFGTLVYLLSPTARPFSPEHVIGVLKEKLRDFNDSDYLLLIGNPALIGFACAIASHANRGCVKVLQWDGVRKEYISIEADFDTDSEWKNVWRDDVKS